MRKCPYCAEEIQNEAIKCNHCGEFLNVTGPPPVPSGNFPWYFRTSVIVAAILSVGPLALPMIWWHPRLKLAWKFGISLAVLVFSGLLFLAMVESLKMIRHYVELFKSM